MAEHSPLIRQWRLFKAISRRRYGIQIREIAEELGVAQKTIRRDLHVFREVGFPLEQTVGERGKKTWRLVLPALPHIHRTLPQGELFHRAIVGRVGKGRRVDCPELAGRDERGKPLRDGHGHVLPLDLDGDQRIEHVLVYAIRFQLTEPVHGPLTLGYGSHFGLGMFAAEDDG